MKVYEIWPFGKPMFVAAKSKKAIMEAFWPRKFAVHIRRDMEVSEAHSTVKYECGHYLWTQNDV